MQTFVCKQCTVCDVNADSSGECTGGSTVDNVLCKCRQGFYGPGHICYPCGQPAITCSSDSTATGACAATQDIVCTCNEGFFGDGLTCSPCKPCAVGWYLESKCTSTQNSVCMLMPTTSMTITPEASTTNSFTRTFPAGSLNVQSAISEPTTETPAAVTIIVHLALMFRAMSPSSILRNSCD
jgi:hypothetical protein